MFLGGWNPETLDASSCFVWGFFLLIWAFCLVFGGFFFGGGGAGLGLGEEGGSIIELSFCSVFIWCSLKVVSCRGWSGKLSPGCSGSEERRRVLCCQMGLLGCLWGC